MSSLDRLGRANKGRYSRSTEKSVEEQKIGIEQLAKKHNCRVIRWYVDESWKGDALDRPDFNRLMEDVQSADCDFSTILCWEQGRFSREDNLTAAVHFYTLRENDITLISVVEGVIVDPETDDDLSQSIVREVVQFAKHKFLKDHAMAVSRAKLEQAKRGVWGGYAPYACRIRDDGRIEAGDPGEVRVLRWIFQAYAEGWTRTAIARELNRRGVPSPGAKRTYKKMPSSGKWSGRTILVILRQRAYIADRRWGVTHTGGHVHIVDGEFVTVHRKQQGKRIPDSNGGCVPGAASFVGKPLIPRKLWETVQRRLDEVSEDHLCRRTEKALPLVGLLRCGICGRGFNTHRTTRGDKQWPYYRCASMASWRQTKPEDLPHKEFVLPADEVWSIVVDKLMEEVLSDGMIAKHAAMVGEILKRRKVEGAETLPELERQAADMRAKLDTLKNNMLYAPDPQSVAAFSAEVNRVRDQLALVTTSISGVKAMSQETSKGIAQTQASLKKYLLAMRDKLLSGDSDQATEAIRALLKRVTVHLEQAEPGKRFRRKSHSSAAVKITGITLEIRDSQDGLDLEKSSDGNFSISKLLSDAHQRCFGGIGS